MTNRLLTASEVADRLSVKESWVREATRDGRLPHLRLGRYRRYHWPHIQQWLQEQTHAGRLAERQQTSM
jgi:excisionase family DNA binding protein